MSIHKKITFVLDCKRHHAKIHHINGAGADGDGDNEMAKYCVAYVNFYDNEMKQVVVDCESKADAPVVAGFATQEERDCWSDYESMERYFFDGDSVIGVMEI